MKRVASCSCGALSITAQGEPVKIAVCHCLSCQRRTGSSFGVAVFYPIDRVEHSGRSSLYERLGDSGKPLTFHFCPNCGSTIFWLPAFRPGLVAIALGTFEDKQGLAPSLSVYEDHRSPWVAVEIERD